MPSSSNFAEITDLLQPQFPDGVEEALNAMDEEAKNLQWSVTAVKKKAAERTGLTDFGDDLLEEPLQLLVNIG